MPEEKLNNLTHYELLFIVPNKFTEDESKEIAKKIKDAIMKSEGKITYSEDWGKKKLAYPIGGNINGYYSLLEFDLAPERLAQIEKNLRLSNEVLRHQIVRKEIKTEAQIAKEKKIAAKITAKTEAKEKAAEENAKAKDVKKMDLKDLDEKLDKILETDDLL